MPEMTDVPACDHVMCSGPADATIKFGWDRSGQGPETRHYCQQHLDSLYELGAFYAYEVTRRYGCD